ncbi:MAG: cell division protein FtsA [Chitinophagaceae bacterium]|nr:cell division protein FtsA [Chitinophagaceae bacterium]
MSKKEQPIIVGLDIGTTKVVAIAGQKNEFGKLEILSVGKTESQGVRHGVVMNIDQCIRSIQIAIEKCLANNADLDIKEVYVGIAGQHIKSLQTRGDRMRPDTDSEITRKEIEGLINDQKKTFIPAGDEIIDIVPQEFFVDDMQTTLSPVGMNGVKIGANFHIVTGDRNAIRNIKRCVERSSMKTKDLVLQPLASAAAVMSPEDLEAGVAIVDIGGGTTDMAVFYDGLLKHTAVIPYAGVNITNDIHYGLGVLRAQAEQLKVQFGTAHADHANPNSYITIPGLKGLPPKEISVKNLAHIIQARTHEILDYVLYHLKQIGLEKRLHGGIILTGGGASLKHITQLTEYVTGMSARIGLPNEHLAGGHSEEMGDPMYSTCIGLILRGYHDFENGNYKASENNLLHINLEEQKPDMLTQPAKQEVVFTEEQEEMGRKRKRQIGKIFDGLKDKLMSMFEDEEDRKFD